jgi:curli biogenesis system outer membrane secretion channel CsgG
MSRSFVVGGAIVAASLLISVPAAPAGAAAKPIVAVLDFSTKGLTSNWWGQWEPGVAVSDLLTDQLVNGGKFDVIDRTHVDKALAEHQFGASGDVDPASAITAGRMVGARYLVVGNIVQFDHTGTSGAGAGAIIPGPLGALAGGVRQDRVTLKISVKVIDARTGRIVQAVSDEKTEKATSIGGGAFVGLAGGGYSNQNFINSSMGHLVNDEAIALAGDLDPDKIAGGQATAAAVNGRILEVDGTNIILNIGTAKGVTVGMYFDVMKVKHIKDPDTGNMLTVNETVGTIEVMSTQADSSIARKVTGTPAAGYIVQSQGG